MVCHTLPALTVRNCPKLYLALPPLHLAPLCLHSSRFLGKCSLLPGVQCSPSLEQRVLSMGALESVRGPGILQDCAVQHLQLSSRKVLFSRLVHPTEGGNSEVAFHSWAFLPGFQWCRVALLCFGFLWFSTYLESLTQVVRPRVHRARGSRKCGHLLSLSGTLPWAPLFGC